MKVLCFDTETTGIAPRDQPCFTNIDNWPYIVQFGFILYDIEKHAVLETHNLVIDVNEYNVKIPPSSTKVHGITNEICGSTGIKISKALNCFLHCIHQCDMLVAHNLDFDWNMVMAEILRQLLMDDTLLNRKLVQVSPNVIKYCTMKNTVELCKIERFNKRTNKTFFKFPKQEELHQFLFGNIPNNLHDAFNDVLVCFRCFYKLWYDEDLLVKSNEINDFYNKVI